VGKCEVFGTQREEKEPGEVIEGVTAHDIWRGVGKSGKGANNFKPDRRQEHDKKVSGHIKQDGEMVREGWVKWRVLRRSWALKVRANSFACLEGARLC